MLFLLIGKEPYNGEWYAEEVFENIDEARAAAKDLEAYGYETNIETIPFWTAGSYYEYQKKAEKKLIFLRLQIILVKLLINVIKLLKKNQNMILVG